MRRAGLIASVPLLAVSCGYVGDPLPPALNIPKPVQDLKATQVGTRLELTYTIPPKTTEELALKDLGAVEVRIGRMPEGGWNQDAWAAAAKPTLLDTKVPGPAESSVDVREFAGQEVVAAMRLANSKGRSSVWSNLVTLRIEPGLVTPADFLADSAPEGAAITWKGFDGPMIVYRDGVLAGEGANGRFVDRRALLGKTYKYEIQAKRGAALGEKRGPVSVTIEDRFPPAAPAGVNAVAGAGTVELTWNRSLEEDILGYIVLRATGTGAFAIVANYVDAPAFTDRDVQRGGRYRYAVAALDLRKNQSVQSQEVEITVP